MIFSAGTRWSDDVSGRARRTPPSQRGGAAAGVPDLAARRRVRCVETLNRRVRDLMEAQLAAAATREPSGRTA